MARFRRALALSGAIVGVAVLGLLWGHLEPESAPPWLVGLSEGVTSPGSNTGGRRAAGLEGPLQIAVAVDDPEGEGPGRSIVNGVRLFLEELNARGGIDGVPLEMEVYDDQGEIYGARQVAQQIAESPAVAVVGPRITATAVAAGPVYQDAGIPAITPSATHPDVTKGNPWFFRTIYDDDHLGRFIAHYVDAVVRPERTVVVSGEHAYGLNLARVFLSTAADLGSTAIGRSIDDDASQADRNQSIEEIVGLLQGIDGPQAVFFATYPEEAIEVIRAIRDAGLDEVALVTPDSFDRPDFASAFDAFPNARRGPGFYTDGIDVATPLIYDTAGRRAGVFRQTYRVRFGEAPDWRAAYAYDAAQAIAVALERTGAVVDGASLAQTRRALREQLAAMDDVTAGFAGITGPIFFDAEGREVPRPAAIGRYHGRQLVSELTQFKSLASLSSHQDLLTLIRDRKIIDIDGQLMKRVEVVYTGINVNDVELDVEHGVANFSGNLWFRSSTPNLESGDVVFINAVGPIQMKETASEMSGDDLFYQKFEISGIFRLDPIPELRQYGRPMLGIGFRHRKLPAQDLIYVVDLRGLGVRAAGPREQAGQRLVQAIEAEGWWVQSPIIYQDTEWVRTEGAPAYLDSPDPAIPYSMLVAAARLLPVDTLIGDLLPRPFEARGFLAGGLILLTTLVLGPFVGRGFLALLLLVAQFLALGVLLYTGEGLLFAALEGGVAFQHLDRIALLFDAAWWLLPAIYLVVLLNRFAWPYVERRTSRAVPRMIKILCAAVILLLAVFGVIGFVYQQPITSLLATSGLVGLIVGLAAQTNLSNVFAGIVLSAERPFALDDVIEVAEHGISRVTNMTWRTTRLVTPAGFEVSVPNGVIAEGFVRNYSRSDAVKTVVDVWLPPALPIAWVTEKIRDGIEKSDRILGEPAPGVEYGAVEVRQNQWAMNYKAYFFVDTPFETGAICSDVSHKIWETLAEAGVTAQLGVVGAEAPSATPARPVLASQFEPGHVPQ